MRDEILNYFRTARRIDLLVAVLVMLFFGGALVLDRVSSGVHLVLLVLGVHAWWKSGDWAALSRSEQFMLAGFAAWFVVGVISYYLGVGGELGMKILGRDLRFLLAIPVYFILKQAGLTTTHLRIAFALGGMTVGLVATTQYLSVDASIVRASGRTISILFGHLCAAIAMLNLVLSLCDHDHEGWWMSVIGTFGALFAVWFSGTRGAVLVAIVLIIGWVLFFMARQPARMRNLSVLSGIFLVAVALADVGSIVGRFQHGVQEIIQLFDHAPFVERSSADQAYPKCLADRAFLNRYKVETRASGRISMSVKAARKQWQADNMVCDSGYRLVIRNTSTWKHARVVLPNRNVPLGSEINGKWMVRGQGRFALAGGKQRNWITVNSSTTKLLSIDNGDSIDGRILLEVPPAKTMVLVPLQIYQSEYTFPEAETSLGSRFYMWREAWRMFMTDPLFGKGVGGFAVTVRQHAREGSAPTAISRFDHPHSEWMTVLSERGVFGLLALLAIYGLPARLFLARRDAIGWAGVVFVLSFLLSGFSETIFNHSLGVTFYALTVLVLAAAKSSTGPTTEPPIARSR